MKIQFLSFFFGNSKCKKYIIKIADVAVFYFSNLHACIYNLKEVPSENSIMLSLSFVSYVFTFFFIQPDPVLCFSSTVLQ